MREIKFRVWLPDGLGTRMIYNPYLGRGTAQQIFTKYCMQYTGLKDKNDKEIYEGDIVSHWEGVHHSKRIINSVVEFQDGAFIPIAEEFYCDYRTEIGNFTVIGNIYENPELLKTD